MDLNCGCIEERWSFEEYGPYTIDGNRQFSRKYRYPSTYCQLHGGVNPVKWESLYGDDANIERIKWELNKLDIQRKNLTRQLEEAIQYKQKIIEDREAKRKQENLRRLEEEKIRKEKEIIQKKIDEERRHQKKKEELDLSIRHHQEMLKKLQDEQKSLTNL